MSEFYIDTHAHIYLEEFDDDRSKVIKNAVEKGVGKILLPNIDSVSIEKMNRLCREFPGVCYPMMGLHPTHVKGDFRDELSVVEAELKKGGYIGVGEIGIDLYHDTTFQQQQQEAFRIQIDMALHYNLPVVIHARESFSEILTILSDYRNSGLKGVFHAFTGNPDIARAVIGLGFLIGIGGILTYKKSELPGVISEISLDHIVLETDSPYLAPVPYRGKRNESGYIPVIAQLIQQIKGIPLEDVARITTRNASELFQLNAS